VVIDDVIHSFQEKEGHYHINDNHNNDLDQDAIVMDEIREHYQHQDHNSFTEFTESQNFTFTYIRVRPINYSRCSKNR